MSGERALSLDEIPATVGDLKRLIQVGRAISKYTQRILNERSVLEDEFQLSRLPPPLRLALVVVPYDEETETIVALLRAIRSGDLVDLARALCSPANPNISMGWQFPYPPLIEAALYGLTDVIKMLIDAMANVDIEVNHDNHDTALHLMAKRGKAEAVHPPETPLYLAMCRGGYEISRILIEAGASKDDARACKSPSLHVRPFRRNIYVIGYDGEEEKRHTIRRMIEAHNTERVAGMGWWFENDESAEELVIVRFVEISSPYLRGELKGRTHAVLCRNDGDGDSTRCFLSKYVRDSMLSLSIADFRGSLDKRMKADDRDFHSSIDSSRAVSSRDRSRSAH